MLEHTFVRTGVIARLRRNPLGPYLDALATALHHDSYAPHRPTVSPPSDPYCIT